MAHRSFRFGVIEATQDPEVSVDDLAASGENDEAHRSVLTGWNHRTPWGGQHPRPPLKMRLRWRLARWLGSSFVPAITKPVRAGEVLRVGGREWVIRHTPGHTEDHICLHDPADGLFLSGDHVLPLDHAAHLGPHALEGSARHLLRLARPGRGGARREAGAARARPSRSRDLAGRCQAIKQHHYDRLDTVKRIGRELGPATVQAFSQKLFKPRSWGEMAESETYAHLEHLRIAGAAEVRRDADGYLLYQTG